MALRVLVLNLGDIETSTQSSVHKIWVSRPFREGGGEQRGVLRIF